MADTTSVTELLATFLAVYFLAAGLGVLVERRSLGNMIGELQDRAMLGYLAGLIAFITGAAIVSVHNQWDSFVAGLVSLIGWVALIEGVLMLAVRRRFLSLFAPMVKSEMVVTAMGIATSVGGLVLLIYLLAT